MRIAVFTDSFYPELGGIQDSIRLTVGELASRGHRFLVLAPAAAPGDFERVGLPAAERDLGPNVTIERVFSVPVPSSSQQSRLALPAGRWARPVAAFRPELVHSHTFLGLGRAARRAARRLGVPLVGTNHWAVGAFDVYAPFARDAFRRLCLRAVTRYYAGCDWVTAPSRFTLDYLREEGLRRPCSVISNPIEGTVFRPAPPGARRASKARLGLGPAVVVSAGRLGREKCVDVILRALAVAGGRAPDASLAVAGHGSERPRLEALAAELGLAGRVRFLGTLKPPALAELFAASEVFAIASTSETQSMVLLQALSCGRPAVGVRSGGLPEYIPPDVGRLVAPGRPEALGRELGALLADPAARDAAGRAAREFAAAFSVSAVADAWEEGYARLLRGERPAGTAAPGGVTGRTGREKRRPACD